MRTPDAEPATLITTAPSHTVPSALTLLVNATYHRALVSRDLKLDLSATTRTSNIESRISNLESLKLEIRISDFGLQISDFRFRIASRKRGPSVA